LLFRFGRNVNDGDPEWPPSPWRVLRALVATARTHADLEGVRGDVDRALTALLAATPPRYRLPAALAAHSRHYFPLAARDKTGLVLDGFHAVAVDDPLEVWFDVELDEAERAALAAVAERIPYLGRSESLCRAELATGTPTEWHAEPEGELAQHVADGDLVDLLCPEPGAPVSVLEADVGALRKARLRRPAGTRMTGYRVRRPAVSEPTATAAARPTTLIFRVDSPSRPGLTEAVTVADALRAAAQSRFGRGVNGVSSPVLSGRDETGRRRDGHRHAHYLAWSDARSPRIDLLAVWAPEGLGASELSALAEITQLRSHLLPDPLELGLAAMGSRDTLRLPQLFGPAPAWETVTPFALVRHPKRRRDRLVDGPEDQVRRELALRGLPEPAKVELVKGAWHEFRRARASKSALRAPAAFGVRLRFA